MANVVAIMGRQRPIIAAITACILVVRLSPLILPLALRLTFDPILSYEETILWGSSWSPELLLTALLGLSLSVALVRGAANFGHMALSGRCGHELVADLRIAIFHHIFRLPVDYAERRETGKILLRFIGDSDALRLWISRRRPAVFVDGILFIVIALVAIWIDWRLGLILLAPTPLIGLAIFLLAPRLRRLTQKSRSLQAGFTGHIQVRIDAIRQSKWLDALPRFRKSSDGLAKEISRQNFARDRMAAVLDSIGSLSLALIVAPLIWFGSARVWSGTLSAGEFVALVWIAVHLSATVHRLCASVPVHQKAMVSLQRIIRLLGRAAERGRSKNLPRFISRGESLVCHELVRPSLPEDSASFPSNLDIEGPGLNVLDESISVSDLAEIILGYRRPQSGSVTIDGQEIASCNIASVRAAIGWVPERPIMFSASVEENISIANPRARHGEIVELVTEFDIEGWDPETWLERKAGVNGRRLSGEDIFLIGLMRALIRHPKILLIDGLDGFPERARILARVVERRGDLLMIVDASDQLNTDREDSDPVCHPLFPENDGATKQRPPSGV